MNPSVILLHEAEVGKKQRVLTVPMETVRGSVIYVFKKDAFEERSVAHPFKCVSCELW